MEDERVRRVDHGRLGRTGDHLGRVGHEPLVELVLAGDEDGERLLALAAGSSHLLAHRRDRAGEPVEHAGVEPADVDAELECRGGHHAAQPAAEQLAFDLPSFFREVAAAVGRTTFGEVVGQPASHVRGDDLGAATAATEADRSMTGRDQRRRAVPRSPSARTPVCRRTAAGCTARRPARRGASRRR